MEALRTFSKSEYVFQYLFELRTAVKLYRMFKGKESIKLEVSRAKNCRLRDLDLKFKVMGSGFV